jgi:predicted MFS family arabinose efflux permease
MAIATEATEAPAAPRFSTGYQAWMLGLLFAVYACSFIDRIILSTVGQAIKVELKLSDLQFGLLGGLAFAIFYAFFGIPIARVAERTNRVTIISICIALWSAMTALSGVAANYWQLLFFRMGVGLGEGGCGPAAQSLLSDHYPPKKRASALAIFSAGVPTGSMIGAVAGGWLTQAFNWRMAFVVVGLPGLILAVLTRLTLHEPPRGHSEGGLAPQRPAPLAAVVRRLASTPTFRHMALGCILINLSAAGINTFAASYLIRRYHMSFAEVGALYGLVVGAAGVLGMLAGGFGTDAGARRDVRWYCWAPAIGGILALPIFLFAFTRPNPYQTAATVFFGCICYSLYFAPTFAVIQNLVDARMRASAAAIMLFLINMFGQGIGPTLMGWVSDRVATGLFGPTFLNACPGGVAPKGSAAQLATACADASSRGLQQAILLITVFFVWGSVHYLIASRSIRRDMSEARSAA